MSTRTRSTSIRTRSRRAITPHTRALVPVHFAGGPCDMDALCDIAAEHDLRVIEDAAHAVEADVRGRKVGCDRRLHLLLALRHQEPRRR